MCAAKRNIFDAFIRCDSSGIARPDNIISASPAPQKRCPSVLKKKLQGILWHQSFIHGELAFAPVALAHEESRNYALALAAGNAGTKPAIPFISIPFSEYIEDMARMP